MIKIIIIVALSLISQPAKTAESIPNCLTIRSYILIYGKEAARSYAIANYTPQQIDLIRRKCKL